jgi:hypothetical protein
MLPIVRRFRMHGRRLAGNLPAGKPMPAGSGQRL